MKEIFIDYDDNICDGCGDRIYIKYDDKKYLISITDDNKIIHYYNSDNIFIIFNKKNKIEKIIHTMTCWSDDYIIYYIENDNIIKSIESYHGIRKLYINYENNIIKDFKYNVEFGIKPVIGEKINIDIMKYYE